MAPVDEISPAVSKFPPVTLPVANTPPLVLTLPVAVTNPPVIILPPVMLPATDAVELAISVATLAAPAVTKLPPVILPVALKDTMVPTLVMLGCEAELTVAEYPEMLIAYMPVSRSLGTVPVVKLLALATPITVLKLPMVALTLPPLMLPVALTRPTVLILPPVTLPVADTDPVTVIESVVIITTLETPATSPVILPPAPRMVQFELPLAN